MRTLSLAILLAAGAVLGAPNIAVSGAQNECSAIGGTIESGSICHVQDTTSTYTMDLRFPTDYADERAIVDYLTQNRDGFVNVSQTPAPGTCRTKWMSPHSRSGPGGPGVGPRAWCCNSSKMSVAPTRRPGTRRSRMT